jgi:hypothetical protein
MRLGLRAAVVVAAFALPAHAGDKSGPAVGSTVSAFDVHDITGPNKGKTLCYV